jgi:hypothetical protein
MVILATPNAATLFPGMTPWNRFHVHEYVATELAELLRSVFSGVTVLGMFGAPELYETEIRRVDAARQRIRRIEEAAARQAARLAADAARAQGVGSGRRSPRPWPVRVARRVIPQAVRTWLRSVAGAPRRDVRQADQATKPGLSVAGAGSPLAATSPAMPPAEPSPDLDDFLRFTVDDLWYSESDLDRAMDLLAICELEPARPPG